MQLSVDNRKIELDDKILIVLRCRMLSDIEVAIQMLEFVRLVDVVVMLGLILSGAVYCEGVCRKRTCWLFLFFRCRVSCPHNSSHRR